MTCGRVPAGRKPNECCHDEHGVPHLPDSCCQKIVEAARLGELQRDAGLGRALMVDPEWTAKAMRTIGKLAAAAQPFTADDVRKEAGSPKEANAMGAVIAAAAAQGVIRRHGDGTSKRASRRRGRRAVWIGKGAPLQAALESSDA